MKTRSYILVTPAKNEEENLPLLAKSVVNQSIRPRLWVIVDDNSVDKTPEIIKQLEGEYEWIIGHTIDDKISDYDPVFRNAITYRIAFKVALDRAKELNIPFGYIGIVDADFVLERKFFEKIISSFLYNPRLGIASGGVYVLKNGRLVWEKSRIDFPRGSPRLIRFECFFDIGGYPREPAPDLISYYLAKMRGWETLQIVDAIGVELRPTGGRGDVLKRYMRQGFVNYYIGVPPLSEILYSVYLSLADDFRKGTGSILGYLDSAFSPNTRRISPKIRMFVSREFSLLSLFSKFGRMRKIS